MPYFVPVLDASRIGLGTGSAGSAQPEHEAGYHRRLNGNLMPD
jgi:hypothetical protein